MLPTQGTKAAGLDPAFLAKLNNTIIPGATAKQKPGSLGGKEVTVEKDPQIRAKATELLKQSQGTELSDNDVKTLRDAGFRPEGKVVFGGVREGRHQLNKEQAIAQIKIASQGSPSSFNEMVDNELYGASGGSVAASSSGRYESGAVNTEESIYEEINFPDEKFQQFFKNVEAVLGKNVTVSEKSYKEGEPTTPLGAVVWQIKNEDGADTGKVGLKYLGQYHQFDSLEEAKEFMQFADKIESAGLRGEVTILSERPPRGYYTDLVVWPSKSKPGKIGGKLHDRMASASDIHTLNTHLRTDVKPASK